jgi:hypothetical protein
MKLTPKQRWAILGTALALTLVAVKWAASKQDAEVKPAQSPRAAAAGETPRRAQDVPRLELERLRRPPPEAARADPFERRSWDVAARDEARRNAPPPPPPAPPRAPPLPFAYLGKAVEDGKVTVFLSRGENTYVVRAGETLDGTYRVERLDERVLVLIYLPLGQRQELALGPTE